MEIIKTIIIIGLLILSIILVVKLNVYKKNDSIDLVKEKTEIENFIKHFFKEYQDKNLDKVLAFYENSKDLVVIGSGVDEKIFGYDTLKKQLERDFEQSGSLQITLKNMKIDMIDKVSWVYTDLEAKIGVQDTEIIMKARVTLVLVKKENKWVLVQEHFSMPYTAQEEGNSFPTPKN